MDWRVGGRMARHRPRTDRRSAEGLPGSSAGALPRAGSSQAQLSGHRASLTPLGGQGRAVWGQTGQC